MREEDKTQTEIEDDVFAAMDSEFNKLLAEVRRLEQEHADNQRKLQLSRRKEQLKNRIRALGGDA